MPDTQQKKKKKLSKTGKLVMNILLVVILCVMCFSGYQLFKIYTAYDQGVTAYEEIKEQVEVTSDTPTTGTGTSTTIDFSYLKKINEDVKGWISIAGTPIDYPFVKGQDNSYYLNVMFDGQANVCGTIFMDYRNVGDFTDKNTILYGHHMQNGTMFAEIENYKYQDYYENHKEIVIATPYGNYILKPVAGVLTNGSENYIKTEFSTVEEFRAYVDRFVNDSQFVSDTTIGDNDQMMLLSTCSYSVSDGRFVLIGKLEKSEG